MEVDGLDLEVPCYPAHEDHHVHCSRCRTVHARGGCPAFVVATGGGYEPPRPPFVRAEHCWTERRYGVLWCCVIGALLVSLLALLACCFLLSIKVFLFAIEYGILVQSVVVAPQGFYVPSDERIYNNNNNNNVTAMGNETTETRFYNTSQALDNVCAIPIRSLRWTDDWYRLVNETAAWNRTTGEVNEAPVRQAFFAPDVFDVLPEALWQMGELPNLGKQFESGEPLDNLQTVCLERMMVELWAAVQEVKLRTENCTCTPPPPI